MAGHFEATPGGGAAVALDEVEIAILRSLAVQLLELIGPGDEPAEGADPLAALFAEGPSEPPTDPALARLFPEAYGDQDTELRAASAEFRRFTENDLRARKRTDALAVVRTLDALTITGDGGAVLELTGDECRNWLGALNDLRLTIGTRLEVSDEDEGEAGSLYRLPDSDPRKPMVMAYLWLGALQETLVETLMP
ncbi:DUF2017 domain-containing protein [Streptomyces sp. NBC_00257]|uniref:DUF2017 domain-containing protein n=1 Tax=Streptomyces TaxID=1883 RepID=UPI000F5C0CA8|nr:MULTISPECIES: DUF2017 domain-containing protein [Streptomyces]WSG51076.1 DUF2017 domain-containing protein [Streptomyces sp. NBC_01732]WSW07604.1 DUF2017 domain-containing protein [Streptomyces sp. NBC_01005]WSX01740.1 DUF2017 domain-containing protein [Streptomyces sp. NBC_00987]WTB54583.1 DUF2017 domain-containing protein [Streptomyces sp. NBC_00826]WTC97113.1 DUF2017 domain-containing protein [Streptomyces sp. NBC_01650]WTH92529.1 DUF2017 domain-containing protein [Streptomyces sp. NBC_